MICTLLYNESMSTKILLIFAVLAVMIFAVSVAAVIELDQIRVSRAAVPHTNLTVSSSPATTLANPASVNCTEKGGTLTIQERGDQGEYGLCMFEDGYACEEWALLRGDCPVGGVRTTGFDTIDQKYCAWSGGQTIAEPNATCTFSDNSTCTNSALFAGSCQKGNQP